MGFLTGSPSKQTSSNSSTSSSQSGNQAYGTLSNALAPTLGYGAQAGNMMAALLGLPSSSPATPSPSPSSSPSTPQYNPMPSYGGSPGAHTGYPRLNRGYDNQSDDQGGLPYQYGTPPETYPQGQGQQTAPVVSQALISPDGAGSALDNFANSAGMDFMRNQGVKAIEASQAGKGMLQSGATGQALESFGQNLSKTYLNDYLTHLTDYAGLGTKNASVLSSAGNTSSSTGMSSGTGSGTGPKQGLGSMLAQGLSSFASAAAGGA